VIVFGDDEGSAEAARELGARHEPEVKRNEFGTILVSAMFQKAQEIARHKLLCYVNCDIVLLPDFLPALEKVAGKHEKFLMVGRRWDTAITEPLAFEKAGWERETRELAVRTGRRRGADWIDYFAFARGTYGEIPDFAVGRTCWDNWLVWRVVESGYAVVDATPAVVAVHQNHDYGHHPAGRSGVWHGEEAARNFALAGGLGHFHTISHATYRLTGNGLEPNRFHKLAAAMWRAKRAALLGKVRTQVAWQNAVWHPLLNATRPLRSALGLRKTGPVRPARKP
jgi:hypothetical protein